MTPHPHGQDGSGTPLLDVRGLTVRLSDDDGEFDAVRDLSFTLHAGETLCIVGESGCGKSLTALALLGLLPDAGRLAAGSILFEGRDLALCSDKELQSVRGPGMGMIFQEPMTSLNPVLRVGDQVAEALQHHLGLSYRDALARTTDLFRQVGMAAPESRLRDYPHQLSGGLRQRVMIAMALSCNPRLLLADEPTTALDVTIQGQILVLLRHLAQSRGMGLLLITHDLGVVGETADMVGVMYAGRIVELAPVRDLFENPMHPYTQGLMRAAPRLENLGQDRLLAIPGTVPPLKSLPPGCAFAPRCPLAHHRCTQTPPPVTIQRTILSCWAGQGVTRRG